MTYRASRTGSGGGSRRPGARPPTRSCSGAWPACRVRFLPRHGRGHPTPPSELNYRANIDALKRSGCTDVHLALGRGLAEGGTAARPFRDRGPVHRPQLRAGEELLRHAAASRMSPSRIRSARGSATRWNAARAALGLPVTRGGTYLVMEGPQFSTKAESELYRQWGCSVIGMTNMPEAKLAREAELCYATVAMVTDFDCWHPDHDHVTVEQVVKVLFSNADKARALVADVVPALGQRRGAVPGGLRPRAGPCADHGPREARPGADGEARRGGRDACCGRRERRGRPLPAIRRRVAAPQVRPPAQPDRQRAAQPRRRIGQRDGRIAHAVRSAAPRRAARSAGHRRPACAAPSRGRGSRPAPTRSSSTRHRHHAEALHEADQRQAAPCPTPRAHDPAKTSSSTNQIAEATSMLRPGGTAAPRALSTIEPSQRAGAKLATGSRAPSGRCRRRCARHAAAGRRSADRRAGSPGRPGTARPAAAASPAHRRRRPSGRARRRAAPRPRRARLRAVPRRRAAARCSPRRAPTTTM